jgi:hypothetical protein
MSGTPRESRLGAAGDEDVSKEAIMRRSWASRGPFPVFERGTLVFLARSDHPVLRAKAWASASLDDGVWQNGASLWGCRACSWLEG